MDESIHLTFTEVDRDVMNTGCVEDAELPWASGWKRTWGTTMPKLDVKI